MWKEESDYSNLSIKILNKILEKIKLDDTTRKGLLQAFIILGKGINVNIPLVSYDMEKAFEQLEKEIGIVFSNSPTHNVGYNISDELAEVEHNHPMLSLDKTKSINELILLKHFKKK